MSAEAEKILDHALKLSAVDKARLVDKLLTSLDKPDEVMDRLWRKEVEGRLEAYRAGTLRAVPLKQVLAKYHK